MKRVRLNNNVEIQDGSWYTAKYSGVEYYIHDIIKNKAGKVIIVVEDSYGLVDTRDMDWKVEGPKPRTQDLYLWAYKPEELDWVQTSYYYSTKEEFLEWFGQNIPVKRLDYTKITVEV